MLAIKTHALLNNKSREWVKGRKNIFKKLEEQLINENQIAWFHCASLGEYEQAKELIHQYKINYSEYKILLTFFSPSGYKNFKSNNNIDKELVETLIKERLEARLAGNYEKADEIREKLSSMDISIKDLEGTTVWDYNPD